MQYHELLMYTMYIIALLSHTPRLHILEPYQSTTSNQQGDPINIQ